MSGLSALRRKTAITATAWLLTGALFGGGLATMVEAHGHSGSSTSSSSQFGGTPPGGGTGTFSGTRPGAATGSISGAEPGTP